MKLAQLLFGTVLGIGVGFLAVPVVNSRNNQARREISDARDAATLVLAKQKEVDELEWNGAKGMNEVDAKSAAKAANLFRQVRDAAREARDCLTEVSRDFQWYELIFFSLPTDCQSMYNIMGETVRRNALNLELQMRPIVAPGPLSEPPKPAGEPVLVEQQYQDVKTQAVLEEEEDRLLIAEDPATLSLEERRKRAQAMRRRILGNSAGTSEAMAH